MCSYEVKKKQQRHICDHTADLRTDVQSACSGKYICGVKPTSRRYSWHWCCFHIWQDLTPALLFLLKDCIFLVSNPTACSDVRHLPYYNNIKSFYQSQQTQNRQKFFTRFLFHASQHNNVMLTVRQVMQHLLCVVPPEQCSTLDIMLLSVPSMHFYVNTRIPVSHTSQSNIPTLLCQPLSLERLCLTSWNATGREQNSWDLKPWPTHIVTKQIIHILCIMDLRGKGCKQIWNNLRVGLSLDKELMSGF